MPSTHVVVVSVCVHAATLLQPDTVAVTEDVAGVALTSLHAGVRREVAGAGEQVGAGGGAGGGAV